MLVVKGLLKSGMTICATIHSPTPFAFNLFDRLMILLGGDTVFFGRNGNEGLAELMSLEFFLEFGVSRKEQRLEKCNLSGRMQIYTTNSPSWW